MVSSVKLAELWQRLGYRVVVACMGSPAGTEQVTDTLTIHRRSDLFLPDPWNYGIAPGFTGLVHRLIVEEQPCLIVVNKLLFWTSLATLSLSLRGRRVLVLTDALVGMTWWPRGFFPRLCALLYAWTLGWLVLLCAERVVLFHPQPRGLLKVLGIAHKVRVIPTGVEWRRYLRQEQGPPRPGTEGAATVTYVGRLESVKGVADLVAVHQRLQLTYPGVRLQVVGWYRPGHPLVTQRRQGVDFLGLRDDIPALLASTDIFVMPSYSEGLSNALMEAMASGCACVASRTGGNAFLIEDGRSGLLFPPGDCDALLAHLCRLVADPAQRHTLGQAAQERIRQHFSWEVVGDQYRQLFAEMRT